MATAMQADFLMHSCWRDYMAISIAADWREKAEFWVWFCDI